MKRNRAARPLINYSRVSASIRTCGRGVKGLSGAVSFGRRGTGVHPNRPHAGSSRFVNDVRGVWEVWRRRSEWIEGKSHAVVKAVYFARERDSYFAGTRRFISSVQFSTTCITVTGLSVDSMDRKRRNR